MKLNNLTIENFRSFDHFTLNDLGRVNLLVGTNNSGKTTILEAVEILMSNQRASAIWSVLARRGETDFEDSSFTNTGSHYETADVKRLFRNHHLGPKSYFTLLGDTELGIVGSTISIIKVSDLDKSSSQPPSLKGPIFKSVNGLSSVLVLKLDRKLGTLQEPDHPYPIMLLEGDGGLSPRFDLTLTYQRKSEGANIVNFVNTSLLTNSTIIDLYENIVLTPEEDLVVEALQFIEPKIERIASTGSDTSRRRSSIRGGILIRLAGTKERIPIASMGDGIWRMLGLALSVVHSRDGILLIDEVDTGLHHSVMEDMWRFLNECSKKFNVQIIATTHSRDCYQSLASLCTEDVVEHSEITIQRIERGRPKAVAYSEAAIIAAADHDIEVR